MTSQVSHRGSEHARQSIVLVTGGSGLVGRALQEVLAEQETVASTPVWFFMSSADADLCDGVAVDALFDRVGPTHVVHLAAHVGGLFANMAGNLEFFSKNMQMCA